MLGGHPQVTLTAPMNYPELVAAMRAARFILTDSGGIQEEAPSLKKPVLLMREVTERPEAVRAGAVKLVGSDRREIVRSARLLLSSERAYKRMIIRRNPYGDGRTSERIAKILLRELGGRRGART
jgi:UDP-N-acetylglucosamine 2-epimerase (non-hydrolysing)